MLFPHASFHPERDLGPRCPGLARPPGEAKLRPGSRASLHLNPHHLFVFWESRSLELFYGFSTFPCLSRPWAHALVESVSVRTCLVFPQCRVLRWRTWQESHRDVRGPLRASPRAASSSWRWPSSLVTTAVGALHDSDCAVIFFLLS